MAEGNSADTIPLHYGPRPALPWMSRNQRKLVRMAIVLAVALTGYFCWQPIAFRARWLYWSRRCAEYQMPSQTEAVVTDPQKVAAILNSPSEDYGDRISLKFLFFEPAPVRMLARFDARIGNSMREPVLFVGALHRPDGVPRLAVLSSGNPNGFNLAGSIHASVMPPASWFQHIPTRTPSAPIWNGLWTELHWYTAVRDPVDPAHLVLHFDMMVLTASPTPTHTSDPLPGDVDVYLQNDDTLRFKLRDTPALQKLGAAVGQDAAGRMVDATKSATGLTRN